MILQEIYFITTFNYIYFVNQIISELKININHFTQNLLNNTNIKKK